MPRNSMDDITPPKRRSIRDIDIPKRRRKIEDEELPPPPSPPERPRRESVIPEELAQEPPLDISGTRRGIPNMTYIVGGVVVVAFLLLAAFAFSFLFAGAEIAVTPKYKDARIDGEFVAAPEDGELSYELMTLEETAGKTVEATGEESVEERASGQITIYNNFSDAEQRLIRNTRFETPEGLIFRINESVSIPGRTETAGGATVPGSITTTVYADEPGESYNIGLTDFTIPGFEGDPQFEQIYARSKTPMTGGFIGTRPTVDEDAEAQVRAQVRDELRNALAARAHNEVPGGFFLPEEGVFVEFLSLPPQEAGDGVLLEERALLHGLLFSQESLGRFIAEQAIAEYGGEPVYAANPENLLVSLPNKEDEDPSLGNPITLTLSGNVRIVWLFNEEQFKNDVAGTPKRDLPDVLERYKAIGEARAVLRPFWKSVFPDDPERITVMVSLPE